MIAEVSLGELPQLLRDLKQRRVINVSHSVCKHLCRDINPWDCLNAMVQTVSRDLWTKGFWHKKSEFLN